LNEQKNVILFAGVTGIIALAAILAMQNLVASPKLLFGRSLSAISPTLFPYITLTLVVLLSAVLILISLVSSKDKKIQDNIALANVQEDTDELTNETTDKQWFKKAAFFVLLVAYGLLLKPFGFLISSCLAITASSLLLGNRHWVQIALLAILAPVCLYLVATRGMLVSLPELNQIELFYSHLIEWMQGLISHD